MAFIERLFAFFALLLWLGTGSAALADQPALPRMAVSIPALRFVVHQLLSDQAKVEVLLPPGANHEAYEPSIAHVRALAEAEIFFSLEHPHFETERIWLARLKQIRKGTPFKVVPTLGSGFERSDDIHCWLSVKTMRGISKVIADTLKQQLPEQAGAIDEHYSQLLERFAELDQRLQKLFAPYAGQSFLVFHPAWGYLAADYNLKQLSIEHHGKEPSIGQFEKLVQAADGIRAVIVEPFAPSASVRFLHSELGLKILQLDPLKEEWIEAMDLAGKTIAEAMASRHAEAKRDF
jgi:zinc transport system substrate-binding protein